VPPTPLCLETPLPPALASQLASFWEDIFGASYQQFQHVLTGAESEVNRNLLYLIQDDAEVVASTQLTLSRTDSRLGGLGEVATASAWRRRGLARQLSQVARDEFWKLGGDAIFLGTVNPQAAPLYESLGWRRLTGANVMCLVRNDGSSDEFFADYFQPVPGFSVEVGSAADRLGMIPLIVWPHEERVLDANLGLFSTCFTLQNSCMGLFPRYQELATERAGQWFVARTGRGSIVGLASVGIRDQQVVQADVFCHPNFPTASSELLDCCRDWATRQGAGQMRVQVATLDEGKRATLTSWGFVETGPAEEIQAAGESLTAVWLGLDL